MGSEGQGGSESMQSQRKLWGLSMLTRGVFWHSSTEGDVDGGSRCTAAAAAAATAAAAAAAAVGQGWRQRYTYIKG